MEYRSLGRTGAQVSNLCLGIMTFGWKTDQDEANRMVDRFLEAGGNFVDTANVYGRGKSETILGNALKANGKRDKVFLATKVHGKMDDTDPNAWGNSRLNIIKACEDSLRRLQTDVIDIYQMHHIDRSAPWDEVWQAMDTLVQQGKVIYVGSSNFAGWHIVQANERAAARGSLGLVSEQSHYNLLVRTVELEVLPACRAYGVGVIPWSPLSGGLLGGVLGNDDTRRRRSDQATRRIEKLRPKLEKWEALCGELGEDPAAIALAWLLHQDGVTGPIIGPRTMEQLEGASLRALDVTLDADVLAKIDEIFPGPGGAAPEAYAW